MNFSYPVIANRYKAIALLGKGGMGEVYRAHDSVLDIEVAVKVLPTAMAELGAARLQREAIALAKLSHPNIAKVLDFAQVENESPYMVMEYLEGTSLDKIIKEKRPDLKTAISIFEQICRGLEYAHNAGVIHRDLKPSNILVLEGDEKILSVKILDFGVAKVASENQRLTSTDVLVGSPLYMSPEQTEGLADKPSTDIYSLGCLMFETLSGKPPLKGASVIETISAHRNTAPPLISEMDEATIYPDELVALVDDCLRKAPEARPSSAGSVAEKLAQIREFLETGRKTEVESIKHETEKENRDQSSRLRITGMVVFLIALTVVAAIFIYQGFSKEQNSTKPKAQELARQEKQASLNEEKDFKETKKFLYKAYPDGKLEVSSTYPVTDSDLVELKNKDIANISLKDNKIDGSGLKNLIQLPIFRLELVGCLLKDENCIYFCKMKKLRILGLEAPGLSDKGLEFLSRLKSVTNLSLSSDQITDLGVASLSKLSQLEKIELSSKKLTANSIKYLVPLKKLNALGLNNISLDENWAKTVFKIKQLRNLNITTEAKLSSQFLINLENSKITSLILAKANLDSESIKALSNWQFLDCLELNECSFDQSALALLTRNHRLKKLHIFNITDPISDDLIAALKKSELEELRFRGCSLDNKQAWNLIGIKTLHILSMQECEVTQEAKEEMEKTIKQSIKRDLIIE